MGKGFFAHHAGISTMVGKIDPLPTPRKTKNRCNAVTVFAHSDTPIDLRVKHGKA
jgi:hypothetical protein